MAHIDYKDTEEDVKRKTTAQNKAISNEYESSFDGEEQANQQVVKIKSKIDISMKEILIDDIITSNYKKVSREDTVIGLNGLVGEWGVVTPIHVLALEDEDCYMLLDGLRRVFSALRNGKDKINAMVWDFTDKEEGKEKANIISAVINRSQKYTAKEQWEQMKILESVNGASPGLIEFLLQMESGDAMKLKDVMLAGKEYEELKQKLLDGDLTIDGAYKKLANARKKENKLAKDDKMVIEEKDGTSDINSGYVDDSIDSEPKLSVSEVKDLLELTDATDVGEDVSLEDLDKTDEIRGNVVQDTKDRKPVDQAVKQNTLIRDNFTCRCCKLDASANKAWLNVMVYHHIIPVYCGGPDTVENGLTLCSNCHLTLHNYLFGKIHIKLDELNEREQKIFRNIFKYGNIALEAQKKAGLGRKEADKLDAPSRKHMYPGADLKLKEEALKMSKEQK